MQRGREDRLERVVEDESRKRGATVAQADLFNAQAAVCAVVRRRLLKAGIDLAQVPALQLARAALGEPASSGATARAASPSIDTGADGLAADFAAKIGAIAQRYRGGKEPDFANASLAELFAWSLAESAKSFAASTSGPRGSPGAGPLGGGEQQPRF